MSWTKVLNEGQVRGLGVLISSSSPELNTARISGINLATMRALAYLGLIEFERSVLADPIKDAGPNHPARVTPAGFRAWADIIENDYTP